MAGVALRSSTPDRRKKVAQQRLQRQPSPAQKSTRQKQTRKVKPKKSKKNMAFQWRLVLLFILTVVISQVALYAYSQNAPLMTEVLKFPGRLVTASVNASIGGVTTGFEGIIETEQQFAHNTFDHAQEDPMMIPVGIVSAAVAIPVGFLSKAPEGIIRYGQEGYAWWDEWFPVN